MEAHQRYSERQDDFVEWVLDRLNPRAGDLVLDVGCGTGSYHAPLCKRGVRAILGIDASRAMIEASQKHANANGLPLVTVLGGAQSLPIGEAGYDCAMANHVLFLVPDQRAALRELQRALRPGGRMVATTTAQREQSRLALMHARAAEALGYAPAHQVVARFNLDHPDLVREVFPECAALRARGRIRVSDDRSGCVIMPPAQSTRSRTCPRMVATGRNCWRPSASRWSPLSARKASFAIQRTPAVTLPACD